MLKLNTFHRQITALLLLLLPGTRLEAALPQHHDCAANVCLCFTVLSDVQLPEQVIIECAEVMVTPWLAGPLDHIGCPPAGHPGRRAPPFHGRGSHHSSPITSTLHTLSSQPHTQPDCGKQYP